ncbi:MAG TPA: hypothetical protein VNU71_00130, partial [Burkholderiaceae bacterium]|nr:hypothetical protein [Burkholderiaceae bacterium]
MTTPSRQKVVSSYQVSRPTALDEVEQQHCHYERNQYCEHPGHDKILMRSASIKERSGIVDDP